MPYFASAQGFTGTAEPASAYVGSATSEAVVESRVTAEVDATGSWWSTSTLSIRAGRGSCQPTGIRPQVRKPTACTAYGQSLPLLRRRDGVLEVGPNAVSN